MLWPLRLSEVAATTNAECNKKKKIGLKTWSRCRGNVVACPALQKRKLHDLPFTGMVNSDRGKLTPKYFRHFWFHQSF